MKIKMNRKGLHTRPEGNLVDRRLGMKKILVFCLIVGVFFLPVHEGKARRVYEFEATPKTELQISDSRPLIIMASGENATATTQVATGNYSDYISVKSKGNLDFYQLAGHSEVEFNTNGSNGYAVAEMIRREYRDYVELQSGGTIELNRYNGARNLDVTLNGREGSSIVETMTEKFVNKGELSSKEGIYLIRNADLNSLSLSYKGGRGFANVLALTKYLENRGLINSRGELRVNASLSKPAIKLEMEGKDGNASAEATKDKLYNKKVSVESEGDIELSQDAKEDGVNLNLDWSKKANVRTTTSTPDQEATLNLKNAEGSLKEELKVEEEDTKKSENEKESKKKAGADNNQKADPDEEKEVKVKVKLETEPDGTGKLIIIRMNPRGSVPVASDAEIVSRRLGMNISQAQDHIQENGGMGKIDYAWKKANSYNPQAPSPTVAGKAGGLATPASVDVRTLNRPSVYKLHLLGPKYKGFLKNSTLLLRLYYPTNERSIRGVFTTITVSEPGPSNNILLVKELPYDHHNDVYRYSFDKADWLTDFDSLEGPYVLLIDVGQSLNFKLGITITEEGDIIPRKE